MPYNHVEIKKFVGLFLQQNTFTVPDGAMEIANNCILSRDYIIQKRPGFPTFVDPSTGTLNNLQTYNGDLIAKYDDRIEQIDTAGAQTVLTGETFDASGRVARSVKDNKNLYITSNDGMKKLTSSTSIITNSGIAPALDLQGNFVPYSITGPTALGPLKGDSQVGYRVVFGKRDENDNLLLGAPGDILVLVNSVFDSGYTSAVGYVVSVTTATPHGLATGDSATITGATHAPLNGSRLVTVTGSTTLSIFFSASDPTSGSLTLDGISSTYTSVSGYEVSVDTILSNNFLSGMTVQVENSAPGALDGDRVITVTGATTFTFSFSGANPATGTLTASSYKTPRIEFTIPDEIQNAVDATEYFYQIYRTSQSVGAAATPAADFSLAKEEKPTAAELATRVVVFDDDIEQVFLDGAAELYTNPNSQEGELQENSRAPLCEDVTLFKEHIFYANTTYRHLKELQLVSSNVTNSIFGPGDYIEIKQDAVTRRYVAREGVGNYATISVSATVSGAGPYTVQVTSIGHELVAGDTILVTADDVSGTSMVGEQVITADTANTFDFDVAATPGAVTYLEFEGVYDTSGNYIFSLLDSANALSSGLYATSTGLVRAVNRDDASPVIARYISGLEDLPGDMFFESKTYDTNPIQFVAVSAGGTTPGIAFSPNLTADFADTESTQDVSPNVIGISKIGEPEAVPRVNQIVVGAANSPILRVFALRDSVLVLKDEGVYRVDGDFVGNFNVTIVDNTVFCLSGDSAALLNNQVIFLSNQGVVLATATSVELISRQGIEDPIQVILGNTTLAANTSGTAHESERLYLLTTLIPNGNGARRVYCWNYLTSGWTTWDTVFKQGVVGPGDALHLISTDNTITKQRRQQNRLDYTDEQFSITVDAVPVDKLSADITVVSYTPKFGDIIVQNGVINRITTAISLGANQYTVGFSTASNLAVGASTIYEGYQSDIKMAPFHGGLTNREKHYPQFQIHTRNQAISAIDITFQNDTFGSSESTEWRQSNVTQSGGWGEEPWGFFGWGQENGINLTFGTGPATIIRIYIPRFAARSSFIQPVLCHRVGGEPMNIQSMGYQVRAYKERVSR